MKKITSLIFALTMILSIAFVGEVTSSHNPFSADAQVTVRKKRVGAIRTVGRGGKYVVRKTWNGTKYVSKKVWSGTKWTGKKTVKTGRKVVSRTKKVVY
ncbi:MAG TPA: hypothetical protein VK400_04155 [Pyrinomonadaceae bacterium]|nr:hypothetical protein [Pyrinomonadaceae bacterium]